MNNRQATYRVLDKLPEGEYHGWQLAEYVSGLSGRNPYPPTVTGYAKDYAQITACDFYCINKQQSLYYFKRLFVLGEAIHD